MVNLLRSLGEHVLLALACVVLLAGVLWFEFYPQSGWLGYALVLPSAALLVLLPQSIRFSKVTKSEWMLGLFVSLAVVLALAFATAWQVVSVPRQEMGAYPLIPLWFSGIAVSLFSAFCFDRLRGNHLPTLPRGEVLMCVGLFVLALGARAWGATTLVPDEFLHTNNVLWLPERRYPPVLGALPEDGYPHVLLYLQMLLHEITAPLFHIIVLQKWMSYISGALSIVFWYGVVRLFSTRLIAVCASLLLIFFGWHWLNSRFIYAYPPDIATIALGILALAIALRTRSMLFASVAGLALAMGFLLQKSGLLLLPFMGYMGIEALLAAPKEHRKSIILIGTVLAIAFCVSYEPILIDHARGSYSMPLQDRAIRERAELLPKLGFNQFTAIGYMFFDAFKQFQVSIHDFPRHIFRPHAPLLDPIFSALFTVGFVYCLANVRRSSVARLCIVGLLVFILPMAFSFPVNDSERGLARRMLGTSLFLAWIASLGAVVIASRFFNKNKLSVAAVCLCSISAVLNVWYYLAIYTKQSGHDWYSTGIRGLQSVAMIDLALAADRQQIPSIFLEGYSATLMGLADENIGKAAYFRQVKSSTEIRSALMDRPGVLQLVVLPWDSKAVPRDSQAVVQELSDIIPPYLWIAGAKDQDGIPMVRYAFVRVK